MSTTFTGTDRPEHDPGALGRRVTKEWGGLLLTGTEFHFGSASLMALDGVEVPDGSNCGWSWQELRDLSAALIVDDTTSSPNPSESQRFGFMYLPESQSTRRGELQRVQSVIVIFVDPWKRTATQVLVAHSAGGAVCERQFGSYAVDSNGFAIGAGGTVSIFTANIPLTEQNTPKRPVHYGGVDDVFEVLRRAAECADGHNSDERSFGRAVTRFFSLTG